MESERRVDVAVSRPVVVGVAVVVDIADVSGRLPLSSRLPPGAATTTATVIQRITNAKFKSP